MNQKPNDVPKPKLPKLARLERDVFGYWKVIDASNNDVVMSGIDRSRCSAVRWAHSHGYAVPEPQT